MIETFYELPCPVSIALLTDFHNTAPEPVLDSLRKQRPEIITVAGDFVRGERSQTPGDKMGESLPALKLLRGCSEIAPTFVSVGNHEWMLSGRDFDTIAGTGVRLLENSSAACGDVIIGGLSSGYFTAFRTFKAEHPGYKGYPGHIKTIVPRDPAPELSWLDDFEKQPGFRILLCHHPEYYPKYLKERAIDLIFSGHCHGGQWRFYSCLHQEERGVFAPGQGLFPALTSGIHDGRLVISRGLSNTTFIPRINNPTEIIYCLPHRS